MKWAMQLVKKRRQKIPGEQQDHKKNYLSENQPLIKSTIVYSKRPDHLLARFNKTPPPNIDKKTGVHAAKRGFITPLTPRELKLKLKI